MQETHQFDCASEDMAEQAGIPAHESSAEPLRLASTENTKMEGVYRKCWCCEMTKAVLDGNDVLDECDSSGRKSQWCCSECKLEKTRIERVQESVRAAARCNHVREGERARSVEPTAKPTKIEMKKAKSDTEIALHPCTADLVPLASSGEIKMEGVYRKCCSCHQMKASAEGNDVRGRCDSNGRKSQWRCSECNNLKSRIARIQDSGRAIEGWNDVREGERARFMERAAGLMKDDLRKAMLDAVAWRNFQLRSLTFKASGDYIDIEHIEDKVKNPIERDSILNNAPRMICPITGTTKIWIPIYSATQQDEHVQQEGRDQRAETEHLIRAKSKAKAKRKGATKKSPTQTGSSKVPGRGGVAEAAPGEEAENAAGMEPVSKRRRKSMTGPTEEKTKDKALGETSMKKLTSKENERLVGVEDQLQDTSRLLHASILEGSNHRGSKVPTNTLKKANAVVAKVGYLISKASEIRTAGKVPHGEALSFFKDAKGVVNEAKEVSAKMSSFIMD